MLKSPLTSAFALFGLALLMHPEAEARRSPKPATPPKMGMITLNEPRDFQDFDIPQAYGAYGAELGRGFLRNPSRLPDKGYGFKLMAKDPDAPKFHGRSSIWGTYQLTETLKFAAAEVAKRYPKGEDLRIVDLSNRLGGPLNARHRTHQNGLDADVMFYRTDRKDAKDYQDVVTSSGEVIDNFDMERNLYFIKMLVETGNVRRIIVDPAIKVAACRFALAGKGNLGDVSETLRRMRFWSNHQNHFHIMTKCPRLTGKAYANNIRSQKDPKDFPELSLCKDVGDPPPRSGCAEALEEARKEFPDLPNY